jgi:DNA-binding CsgD family transcriptional regulator
MPIQRPLTAKQQMILRAIALGRTNKDIANEIGISEQGVKVHVSRLLERYGAENRVELVTLTRTWPDADVSNLSDLSDDIAGIRAGLNTTDADATAFGQTRGRNGNGHPAAAPAAGYGHAAGKTDLGVEVRALRETLLEINVALKLARELPPTADVGPIVDAIHKRVNAALEQSERLDLLIDDQRHADRMSRDRAS